MPHIINDIFQRVLLVLCIGNFGNSVTAKTYYLYVILNGKPKPMMNDIIILPDTEMIEISCWGIAIPAPKVTFSFTPCPSLEWNNCNSSTVTLDETTTYSNISTITFKESVRVLGSHLSPGIVNCKAANSEGTSYTRSKLFRRNQRETIMLQELHPNTVIYAGDSITVRCSVDYYNFTDSFTFYAQNQRHQVRGQQYNFSWVAEFTVADLSLSENQIECQSKHRNGSLVTKRLTFTIVQPYISVQHRSRMVVAKSYIPLLLSCNVNARPMPEYRWFKDDVQLPNTNFMIVISPSEADQFDCYAKNRAGEVRLTWVISNSNKTLVDFDQLTLIITLFLVFTMGVVCCYCKTRQLCTLFRVCRAIRTREP
ncbi:protein ver-1-like [Anopheles moucheti]|uniref:protein ver-1-like n=1 Tax=Anopheles moucheti TaxID=186751 RepID=UPI0022F01523|nr:protein ver-1-like [Anopheles moucheti]